TSMSPLFTLKTVTMAWFRSSMNAIEHNRCDFIKASAMTAATAAASGSMPFYLPLLHADDSSTVTWNKAPCRFCGTGCHVQVGVRDGRVVAIAGDKDAE